MSLHLEMAPDVGIREADDIAERVKAALRDEPGIQDAQTHLEPLEQPVATHPAQDRDHPEDSERRRIIASRREPHRQRPRELRMLHASAV